MRNVDLVHEQLKTAIEGCSKQQRLWQSEKQELMKKNAELDLTKFSDRSKIYELQIETNRLKRLILRILALRFKAGMIVNQPTRFLN